MGKKEHKTLLELWGRCQKLWPEWCETWNLDDDLNTLPYWSHIGPIRRMANALIANPPEGIRFNELFNYGEPTSEGDKYRAEFARIDAQGVFGVFCERHPDHSCAVILSALLAAGDK